MRYVPAAATALGIAGVIIAGIVLTGSDLWVFGCLAFGLVKEVMPKDPEIEKARIEAASEERRRVYGD